MNTSIQNGLSTDQPGDASAAINSDVLLKNCLGSVEFALTLLEELEASGMTYIESIANHATAADCEATADAAHSLKGAAGIIGAEALQLLAAKIESAGKSSDIESITRLIVEIRQEMEKCIGQIQVIRHRNQSEKSLSKPS